MKNISILFSLLFAILFLCESCTTKYENPFLGKWNGVEIESKNLIEKTNLNFTLDFLNDKDLTFDIVRENNVFMSENYNYVYNESDSLIVLTSEVKDTIPNIGTLKALIRFKVKSINEASAIFENVVNDSIIIKWDLKKI